MFLKNGSFQFITKRTLGCVLLWFNVAVIAMAKGFIYASFLVIFLKEFAHSTFSNYLLISPITLLLNLSYVRDNLFTYNSNYKSNFYATLKLFAGGRNTSLGLWHKKNATGSHLASWTLHNSLVFSLDIWKSGTQTKFKLTFPRQTEVPDSDQLPPDLGHSDDNVRR